MKEFWLGGRNNDVAGNWTWVDGAKWGFEAWSLLGWNEDTDRRSNRPEPNDGPNKCLMCYNCENVPKGWYDQNCAKSSLPYVCGFQPDNIIRGRRSVAFTFQQHNISEEGFHVWWKSFSNKSKSTQPSDMIQDGFVLKWKSESEMSDMEMERTGVSGYAETPDFGGEYDEELYTGDMRNTLTVLLPDDLEEAIGTGRLVVDLSVNTGEGEGWKAEIREEEIRMRRWWCRIRSEEGGQEG